MADSESEVLVSRTSHGVQVVQFARPRRKHAFTAAMYERVAVALREADSDETCGAVLLRGDEAAFSAGNDLEDFLHRPPTDVSHPVFALLTALVEVDVPLVAAVCGPAIGIGTTMLLHCDVVVAGASAKFRVPFVDLGLCPEAGSSLLLARLVGERLAARMLLLGETLDADAAQRAGLVTQVCRDAAALTEAMTVAEALAAKPRDALRGTKRLARDAIRPAIRDAMQREGVEFLARLESPAAKQAFAAFLERRKG